VKMASMSERLIGMDAHSSVSNEFRVRTAYGAILSTFTMISIAYLVWLEYDYNFLVETVSSVHVNATSPTGLQMEIDITIPNIPCALLSIEAEDPTGQPQSLHIDKTHRMFKHRLDKEGNQVGRRSKFEFGDTMKEEDELSSMLSDAGGLQNPVGNDDEVADEELCGSCYGAAAEDECCNTCDDVKRAYKQKGWHVEDLDKIKQCKHTKTSKEEVGEGCNIHGNVALGSGGGNFHIVPSRDLENFGHEREMNIADFFNNAFEAYDVSHTLNKIRFGRPFPGQTHQLDGKTIKIDDTFAMYQYYLQVVPSKYTALKRDKNRPYKSDIETFQFSVTEHERHVGPRLGRGLPGVYFYYEVSPLHVEVKEINRGWVHFFTGVCAVVGGLFTFMGIIDGLIYDATLTKTGSLVS